MLKYNLPSKSVAFTLICIIFPISTCIGLYDSPSPVQLQPKNTRVLEHLSSRRCLTVSDEFVLFLDECPWNKGREEVASVFAVIKSNAGGHLLRWSSGPKPAGIQGCLTDRVESEYGEILSRRPQLVGCDARSSIQSWRFQKVDKTIYLIRRVGQDGLCLTMSGHDNEDYPKAAACDGRDEEQKWRICENVAHEQRCDE